MLTDGLSFLDRLHDTKQTADSEFFLNKKEKKEKCKAQQKVNNCLCWPGEPDSYTCQSYFFTFIA